MLQALNRSLKWHPGAGEAAKWHSSGFEYVEIVYPAGCPFINGFPENLTDVPAMVLDSLLCLDDSMVVSEYVCFEDDPDDGTAAAAALQDLGRSGMKVSSPCTVRHFMKVRNLP